MKMALTNRGVWTLALPVAVVLLLATVATSAPLPSLALPALVPAFAWSNHRELDLPSISYETISAEDLVGKVKREIVWPQTESAEQQVEDVEQDLGLDVVLLFVGTKLRSGDVSRVEGPYTPASDLLQVLRRVVTSSNSSVSLPYVTPPRDGESVTDVLVKEIVGGVEEERESRLGELITTGACVSENGPHAKRLSLNALQEYLPIRMSSRLVGNTDLVVVCGSSGEGNSVGSKSVSEGEILDGMLWGLDELRARYVALYTTDLSGKKSFHAKPRGRQLGSVVYADEEYCNEVCQTKAIILEGLLVGLTLLVILISGLCCMAGITTPSRFEQNKDGQ